MSGGPLLELQNKSEIDYVITQTEDQLVVLRFGTEHESLKVDHVMGKACDALARMASIYTVDPSTVPEYVQYFDITLTPSTLFFYNGQHLKCDYGTPDHTKWVGSFHNKEDFIDLVEAFYRGAMHGKYIVQCPIPKSRIPRFDLLYLDY